MMDEFHDHHDHQWSLAHGLHFLVGSVGWPRLIKKGRDVLGASARAVGGDLDQKLKVKARGADLFLTCKVRFRNARAFPTNTGSCHQTPEAHAYGDGVNGVGDSRCGQIHLPCSDRPTHTHTHTTTTTHTQSHTHTRAQANHGPFAGLTRSSCCHSFKLSGSWETAPSVAQDLRVLSRAPRGARGAHRRRRKRRKRTTPRRPGHHLGNPSMHGVVGLCRDTPSHVWDPSKLGEFWAGFAPTHLFLVRQA